MPARRELTEHLDRDHARVVRTSRQDVHDVEHLEGGDDRRRSDHGDRRPQQRRHDQTYDPHLARAVHPGGLEDLGADCLQAGRNDDHTEARERPYPDEDKGRVVGGLVTEPCHWLKPHRPEGGIQGAGLNRARRLVVEHELPYDRSGHGADRHRKEDGYLRDRLVSDAIDQDGNDQAEADAEDGEEYKPEEAVSERKQRVRKCEEVLVVGESDELRGITAVEAQDRRIDSWVDHEYGRERNGGQRPEVWAEPRLQPSRQALQDTLAHEEVVGVDRVITTATPAVITRSTPTTSSWAVRRSGRSGSAPT